MARYSIEDTTLTALGDAVRGKVGETKDGYVDSHIMNIEFASSGANSRVFYQFPTGTRSAKIKKIFANQRMWVYLCDSNKNNIVDGTSYIQWMLFDADEDIKENVIQDGYCVKFQHSDTGSFKGQFEITSYDADGNVIQVPGIVKNTMTPLQMAEAIEELPPSPPESAFTLTGDCGDRFKDSGWDWFLEQHGDKITTKDITDCSYMFYNINLKEIPSFDINIKNNNSIKLDSMFMNSEKLTKVDNRIIGKVSSLGGLFNYCESLREVSDEFADGLDGSYLSGLTSAYSGDTSSIFKDCCSLRKYPNKLLKLNNPVINNSYATYRNLFNNCYALDEVIDLPVVHRKASWTSNTFYYTFSNCNRLRKITFETNEDGSPIKVDGWSKQAIDLSAVGFTAYNNTNPIKYNSGITTATRIRTIEEYEALKDNPDRWTDAYNYSLYDKTCAIETINTLPDLSGGAGGNTIKFKGAAGESLDIGAINTMTEDEIAVATAKGWTVSFT